MKRKPWENYYSPESQLWHMDFWDNEEELDLWFCSGCDEYWAIRELPANIVFEQDGSKDLKDLINEEIKGRILEEEEKTEVESEPIWDGKRKFED
jgi:hypothetical protein